MSATSSSLPRAAPTAAWSLDPELRVADPDRRFYAFAVDRLIGWGLDAVVTVVVGRYLWSRGHVLLGVLALVATVLVVGLASAVLLGTTGATPGKSLLGLRVVHTGSGRPIGTGPAILRTAVLCLAGVPFGFGLAALAWTAVADTSRLRRGWHDLLVSSIVLDVRAVPAVGEVEDTGPRRVVNLTALRLAPARRHEPAGRTTSPEPTEQAPSSVVTWGLDFDTGERVVVDTLVLVGSHPRPSAGEQCARLVALHSTDTSLSPTHARVVVAFDGALVVTDCVSTGGSTGGSTLVRQGLPRPLTPGRPTTLLEGDVVTLGDRTMTVRRI